MEYLQMSFFVLDSRLWRYQPTFLEISGAPFSNMKAVGRFETAPWFNISKLEKILREDQFPISHGFMCTLQSYISVLKKSGQHGWICTFDSDEDILQPVSVRMFLNSYVLKNLSFELETKTSNSRFLIFLSQKVLYASIQIDSSGNIILLYYGPGPWLDTAKV